MAQVVATSVNRIWDEYETNNDGLMQFSEAKRFLKEVAGPAVGADMNDASLLRTWNQIDKDADGLISRGEMAKFIMNLSRF